MNDLITVHRIGQPPIEVPPERCIFTDRSRIEDGSCPRRRYLRYELDGMGYVSPSSNEDLVIGGATHEGLDVLLQGGTLKQALAVTEDYFWENICYPDYLLPEQQDALGWDGCNIAKAFVYSFDSAYLQQLLDTYEVMEVEEEINWLVGEVYRHNDASHPDYIVMMSRPDGVLRHKETGRLWHVSHKTAQIFNDIQVEKLKIDSQRFSESMAVWAKYGEPPEGTLYNYFLKGKRYQDKDLNIDRFSSGLIHPYMQRMGPGGDINAEMLSFVYEWNELEDHNLRSRRLGKGWERVTIYNEMDFFLYLNWLENEAVPRHKDYLKESIVGLKEEFFDQEFAQRWVTGVAYAEEEWAKRVEWSSSEHFEDDLNNYYAKMFPLQSSECFSWNKKCTYHGICWDRQNLASLIEEGRLIPREPNHLVEALKITKE
jgi:hypothetical protein